MNNTYPNARADRAHQLWLKDLRKQIQAQVVNLNLAEPWDIIEFNDLETQAFNKLWAKTFDKSHDAE